MKNGEKIRCVDCAAYRPRTMEPQFCRGCNPPNVEIECQGGTKINESVHDKRQDNR